MTNRSKILLTLFCTLSLTVSPALMPVDAQQMAEVSVGQRSQAATKPRVPSDRSSDGFFSEDDFTNSTTVDKTGHVKAPEIAQTKVPIKIFVNVPHNREPVNMLACYPYPMRPPKSVKPKLLPFRAKDGLRDMILSSGYTGKQAVSLERAYPTGGWRWQYCFQSAVRHYGQGAPHIMSEMYTWTNEIMPYVISEVLQSNRAEMERWKRQQACMQEFEDNRAELEAQAMHDGYSPEDVKMFAINGKEIRFGRVSLRPGQWWLVGTHKVPGLTYYWQQPFEVKKDEPQTLILTEQNALLVTGGW